MKTSVGNFENLLRKTLLSPILREVSEDLRVHYLRNWDVRDLLGSPLMDSVLGHDLRQFYKLFYHTRHGNSEKSAPRYAAGFGLA